MKNEQNIKIKKIFRNEIGEWRSGSDRGRSRERADVLVSGCQEPEGQHQEDSHQVLCSGSNSI
jgi:hypothetical protein